MAQTTSEPLRRTQIIATVPSLIGDTILFMRLVPVLLLSVIALSFDGPTLEAHAQAAAVAGRVVDAVSGRPVRGAHVEVIDTQLMTTTDDDGGFTLEAVPSRALNLRAVADGYDLATVSLRSGDSSRLEVRLTPRALHFRESVVVSAGRAEASSAEVPRSVAVVTADDLRHRFSRTTPEALLDVPGVLVQKTNHGGGSPYLRGLVGNQVLVLVDGIRLNNSTFRYGPNQYLATVDVGQIERIEVVRGSGSVLFGSDAMGGVINIVTKRPALSGGGVTFGGSGSARVVSDGMERSGRLEVEIAGARAAVLGGVSARDYGDLRAGGTLGVEAPSAYSELNGDVKAIARLTPRSLLTLVGQQVHQDDVPRFDQVAQRGFSRYSFDPQVRRLGYAQWQLFPERGRIQSVTSTVSRHQSVERRIRQQRGSPISILEEDDVRALGVSVDVKTTPLRGWAIVSGIDYLHDRIGSWRRDTNQTTGAETSRRGLYPDGATTWSAAGFGQGTLQLERTRIEAGLRFSQYSVHAEDALFGTLEIRPRAWVGTIAASRDLSAGAMLFGSASQAFRSPNVDDLSTLGNFDFGVEVPSPALKPERSLAFEGGLRVRHGGLRASVAAYRMNLNDLIDRVRSTFDELEYFEGQQVYRRINVGKAYVYGVEAEGEWSLLRRVSAFGHASYTYGQQTTTGQPMRRIPPLHGLAGLRAAPAGRAWIEGAVRFATTQDRLAPGDRDDHRIPQGGTPGWVTVSLSAGMPLHRQVELVAGIHNMFDRPYRIHGSGIDGYGRSAWLGTHVRF